MKEKVQIIQFHRNPDRPTDYNLASTEPTGLNFDWFRVTPTRDNKILRYGAKQCLEYWNGQKWKHITGLFKINEFLFYGDINMDTAAIYIDTEQGIIKIAILKGHRPKTLNTRKKKVNQFLAEQKKVRENSL